jgi:CVNH domain
MKIASASARRLAPLFVVAICAVMSQPAGAASPAMPGGQWHQTCEDASIRGNMLYARCRQDSGQYRSTSALLLGTCQSYSNRNGQLYCDKNGNTVANSRWSGSYGESCRNIDVDKHGRLSADCRRQNGKSNRSNITPQQCPSYRAGNRDGQLFCEPQASVSNRWDGSFQKSCRDVAINSSGTLTATCKTTTGTWQRTSLAPGHCDGYRAGNNDGRLVCESQASANSRWDGSFQRSCRDIAMNSSGPLTATCQARTGDWQRTSLAPAHCDGYRAGNNNGQLVCESRDSVSNRWQGSFKNSCRDSSMDSSGSLTATCQASNGTWRPSSLGARQCNSYRAGNNNGQLVCESQGDTVSQWQGSFKNSCRDIATDSSGSLTATCQTMNGDWQRTSLGSRQCGSVRAGNNNGQLVCES